MDTLDRISNVVDAATRRLEAILFHLSHIKTQMQHFRKQVDVIQKYPQWDNEQLDDEILFVYIKIMLDLRQALRDGELRWKTIRSEWTKHVFKH